MNMQRTMGLYGAFIIRERKPIKMQEHIMVISDYNHHWESDIAYLKMTHGMYVNRTKVRNTRALDGSHFSSFNFHSVWSTAEDDSMINLTFTMKRLFQSLLLNQAWNTVSEL